MNTFKSDCNYINAHRNCIIISICFFFYIVFHQNIPNIQYGWILLELFIIIIFKQFYDILCTKHSVYFNNIFQQIKKNTSTLIMAINHQNPLRFLYHLFYTNYIHISTGGKLGKISFIQFKVFISPDLFKKGNTGMG